MTTIDITEKSGSVTQYVRDHNGVIKQLFPHRFTYDDSYLDKYYNDPKYLLKSEALQRLRLGFIQGIWPFEHSISSLIDVGFGSGAFLKYVRDSNAIPYLYGHDIADQRKPKGVELLGLDWPSMSCSVATFWDVLEHYPDHTFLQEVKADITVVSCPWCHFNKINDDVNVDWHDYFRDWHHRKPNEHLHHFDPKSLTAMMRMYGWAKVATAGNLEDIVRRPRDHRENILTMAFKRI